MKDMFEVFYKNYLINNIISSIFGWLFYMLMTQ